MNPNEVIGGLMTGSINLTLGCGQSRKLKDVQNRVNMETGAMSGSITVSGKLWEGSKRVKALMKHFTDIKRGFDSYSLPWSKGVRIFKVDRIENVYQYVNDMMATVDPMVDAIVNNYDNEREDAVTALGSEGRLSNYPSDGYAFKSGIVKRFVVDTIGASHKLLEMVGGALGNHLAREHEQALRESIGQSQQDAADRLADILARFVDVCDPGKERTRVTESLFKDFKQLTEALPDLLLFPNPKLFALNERIKLEMAGITKDELSESREARAAVHAKAKTLIDAIGLIPMV